SDMDAFLKDGKLRPEVVADLPVEERELAQNYSEDGLKRYLGKKAVARLGCYACHDIPGFDNAKSIGVDLNDWGKKDPGRLAFENIKAFINDKYHVVPSLVDEKGKPVGPDHGKPPYEQFFAEQLGVGGHGHHGLSREGYLHQ